jgi:hypothetical protein
MLPHSVVDSQDRSCVSNDVTVYRLLAATPCWLAKCVFFKRELAYLGHVVGRDGLKVDPKKVKVVEDWPSPKNAQDVRRFLGLANYFRKFIQNYSNMAAPLTALTGTQSQWSWGEREQQAFEGIQHNLTHAPVLALPDQSKDFKIISYARLALPVTLEWARFYCRTNGLWLSSAKS